MFESTAGAPLGLVIPLQGGWSPVESSLVLLPYLPGSSPACACGWPAVFGVPVRKEANGWPWVIHALWGIFEILPACSCDGEVLQQPSLTTTHSFSTASTA